MDDSKAHKDQNPSSVGPLQEASVVYVSLADSLGVFVPHKENADASLNCNCNCPVTDEIDRIGEESQKNVDFDVDEASVGGDALIGDSISMYVEFPGSESESGHENADDVGLAEIKEEGAGDCLFSVGDVVWVKTRNHNWWAGKIYDPSTASNHGVKSKPKKIGFFLVGHFVSGHVGWYPLPQLKPFHRNFEEMSKRSESRNFLCAVEKAVEEFGKNVSTKLIKDDSASLLDEFGEISSILINPKKLISYVKSLSVSSASVPNSALDLSIATNYLSLFYRSIGHLNLSVNVLRGAEDELTKSPLKEGNSKFRKNKKKKRDQDSANESGSNNAEGSVSRARKKSKYLSYPYINLEKKEPQTDKEGKTDLNSSADKDGTSPAIAKNSSKNKNKGILVSNVSIPEMVSIPSTEILSELCVAAVEPAYLKESRNFDKVEGFFYRFRSFSYRDNANDSKNVVDEEKDKEKAVGCADPSLAVKFEPKKRRKREKAAIKKEIFNNVESKPGIIPVVLKKDIDEKIPGKSFEVSAQIKEQIEGATQIKEQIEGATQINEQIEGATQIDNNVESKNPPFIPPPHVTPVVLRVKESVGGAAQVQEPVERAIKVPDLNGEVVSATAAPKKRRRRSKEEIAEAEQRKTEQSSVLPDGTVQKRRRPTIGTPLLLTFDKSSPLPTKETVETELGKFGALKGIEFPLSEERQNMARVVFERKADAKQASKKLTKANPFGAILLKHELEESGASMALKNLVKRALPILKNGGIKAEAPKMEHREIGRRLSAVTLTVEKTPKMAAAQTGEGPPLDLMKRNLEMMTSMLQKSGDNLSPETKAKLELEIKGLLGKVSTMVCSSSSS